MPGLAIDGVGEARLADQIGAIANEPIHIREKQWQRLNRLLLDDFNRVQGDQSDERPNLELVKPSIGVAQDVVEKAVALIPQLVVSPTHFLHRTANVDEM